ncbi:class I SAM-dependent methyltransferase [uncultured Nisaea sp.]|uniref:class I SAM-dependent methyltransferase n=1 Tax=uncultured Nisaea sp. TaxID=538215 RepID=UPI0030EC5254|tara:strand:+ start:1665 stop:2378 length:714 start_codon:yes stop_codon:yes gene_type:complete
MLVGKMTRKNLLACLPAGGVAIEIGVAEGVFSSNILEMAKPSNLHLVDPWIHQSRPDYQLDANNVDDEANEERYQAVLKKFRAEIESDVVHVHRGFSKDVLPEFDDHAFDWAYVDAMHTRDAVREDLQLVWPKVKPDGLILGHDFSNSQEARARGFGVVDGVQDFIRETGAHLVAMTMISEFFPSYVLAKSFHPRLRTFAEQFVLRSEATVEIRSNSPDYQHKMVKIDGKIIAYPSF